ncbi:MAG: carbohydrate ABC transporter permease [Candidatus Omnitrophica bacterium]|nr:L-arabinose transport system permease protein AraQ [bacterium]NUN96836.1 carbohydrate ABC transporter permease [Candidatus Omnitrophota bacterium]
MSARESRGVAFWGRTFSFMVLAFYTAMSLLSLYLLVVGSLSRIGTTLELSDLHWYPKDWAWENFATFLEITGGAAPIWFRNSFLVAFLPTVFNLFFSAMAGYALAKLDFPGRQFIFWTIIAVMAIPAFVTLIPMYQMMFRFGWFDTYFALLVPRMAGLGGIFLFKQFTQTLPGDLMEAARMDGASEATIFLRIVLPLATPVLAVMFLLDFVAGWSDYFWPYLVTNSRGLLTLQVGLISLIGVDQGFILPHDMGAILAGALIASLPVIVLFVSLQKYFVRGLTLGAVKG